MALKKSFQKTLKNKQSVVEIIYLSAKYIFISVAFIFFLLYFFISANFYAEEILWFFLAVYISFLLSFSLFFGATVYRLLYKKMPIIAVWAICLLWVVAGAVFLIPVF